ncbi:unnamed protein product, partial [Mesorhabditis spiculigera]
MDAEEGPSCVEASKTVDPPHSTFQRLGPGIRCRCPDTERQMMQVRLEHLEFEDACQNSPFFRDLLGKHENVLEVFHNRAKLVEQFIGRMLDLEDAKATQSKLLYETISQLAIDPIGKKVKSELFTDDCFGTYSKEIQSIEEAIMEKRRMQRDILKELRDFRIEKIEHCIFQERKQYKDVSAKFVAAEDKFLGLLQKNRDCESDSNYAAIRLAFERKSIDYVLSLQSLEDQIRFEYCAIVSKYLLLTYGTEPGHEFAKAFINYIGEVQERIETLRSSNEFSMQQALILKSQTIERRMNEEEPIKRQLAQIQDGYLLMHIKKPIRGGMNILTKKWSRVFVICHMPSKSLTVVPTSKEELAKACQASWAMKITHVTALKDHDRKYIFEVSGETGNMVPMSAVFQAVSEKDFHWWFSAMESKDQAKPQQLNVYLSSTNLQYILSPVGVHMMKILIENIEERDITSVGIYRVCAPQARAKKLLTVIQGKDLMVGEAAMKQETDVVLCSALKSFLRELATPLIGGEQYGGFLTAAASTEGEAQFKAMHVLLHQLPALHKELLKAIILHLKKVSEHSELNKMTVPNLGICFGPTLLRPVATVAGIHDVKFYPTIVEVLINNADRIFEPPKDGVLDLPVIHRPIGGSPAYERLFNNTKSSEWVNPNEDAGTAPRLPQQISLDEDSLPGNKESFNSAKEIPPVARTRIGSGSGSGLQRSLHAACREMDSPICVASPPRRKRSYRAVALYDCVAEHDSEITFCEGDIIEGVVSSKEQGWLIGTVKGQTGLLPANFIKRIE